MAYQSGRTVKRLNAKPTTVASATRDARRLIGRNLPGITGITVESRGTADPTSLAPRVRTRITHPAGVDTGALFEALRNLPGVVVAVADAVGITLTRDV